jgi:Calx-beta domain
MTTMTSAEQLILEMINRARMDPDGEAARLAQTHPGFTLNEGLAAGTISSTPKQVLAGNNTLAGVADNHNAAMLSSHVLDNNNLNPHTQAGDGADGTRIANAGYQETYPAFQTYHDENIAWQGTSGAIDLAGMTQQVEDGLFVDSYDSTRLHRVAIMDGTMREVGVGETTGVVQGYNSVVVTEDFGISGTNSFLTGAVYNDVNGNNFYDLNEGVQGVTATVTTTGGTLVGSDTTGSGGGWSVSEPGGTYNVTFTGAGLVAGGVMATVAGGSLNAKVDLVNGNAIFSNVNTTLGAGAKDLHLLGIGNINATGNALDNTFYGTKGNNVIDGGAGTDTMVYSGNKASYTITPNADGSMTVTGPDGTDTLISIEKIQFADQTYTVPSTNPGSVSINDVSITEGNAGTQLMTFTVTRTGGTAAFSVNYATQDGTATTADNDYAASSSTLQFAANEMSKAVSITINGDTKVEANETFNVNLSAATNGATITRGQGVGTIINDDVAPVAGSVSINNVSITEGNSGTQLATFTVTRTGGTAAFSVNYATQDGTATTADNDYVASSSTLQFAANETSKTVSVTINGDTKVEANETFNVNLTGATNGATISKGVGVGTIINDDVAPVAGSVTINDVSITEGNSGTQLATFTVTRTGGTAAFSVNYATQDGTATTADNDYVASSSTLQFAANEMSKTVSVTINGDTKVEANETFNVNLTGATNGATISKGVGVGTIINDDVAPVAGSVSINDAQIVEGNNGTQLLNFTVTRTGGTAAFDVNYGTSDGTATVADNDYVNVPTTALHFNAGDTTKTVSVRINGDTKVEGNENFNVSLTGATNGATISKGVGVGTIINDDVAVVDTPPTVTGSNVTARHGQSFAASSLFTARDADGDTITKYAFWDTGAGRRAFRAERGGAGCGPGDRCHRRAALPVELPVRLGRRHLVGGGL